MGESNEPKDRWSTTRQIEVIKEAVEGAMEHNTSQATAQETSAEDLKIPLKITVAVVIFCVTQVLAIAGTYYDLRGDVRALQEESEKVVQQDPAIAELRLRADQLEKDITRIESNFRESPTSLDNMRRVGELNGEVRELKARISALERR